MDHPDTSYSPIMEGESREKEDQESAEETMAPDDARVYTFEPAVTEQGSATRQYVAAISANLLAMTAGSVLGWTSPTLPRLYQPDSFLPVTSNQGSWIASLVPLGAVVGPFIGGYLADKIGRKWTMMSLALPFILSWILITAAQNVAMLYSARVIAGIAVGALFAVAPTYNGEIAEDKLRGALGSLLNAFITAGFLYEYVIGPYVPYIWLGIASLIVPCVFAISFFFMPETPSYLLARGKSDEASRSLQWLRGLSKDGVNNDLMVMQAAVDEASQNSSSFKDLIGSRGNVKALYISFGLVGLQQFSGINAILFFSTAIFQLSGSGSLPDDVSTIIIGVVMMFSAFCAPLLVEWLGRRPLLFISATGMAISQFVLGLFFYLKTTGTNLDAWGWLPILSLVIYIAVYSIGFGPLPWAVMGELFPANIKSLAAACTASFCWLLGFIITLYFQDIVVALGTHVAFWIFAGCCIIADIFVFFLLPETKGKTLQEIQDMLNQ